LKFFQQGLIENFHAEFDLKISGAIVIATENHSGKIRDRISK